MKARVTLAAKVRTPDGRKLQRGALKLKVTASALLSVLLFAAPALAQTDLAIASHQSAQGSTGPREPQIIVDRVIVPTMCDFGPSVSSGGEAEARATLLDKSGPQLPPVSSMSAFSVTGFVKGSWPVVFDYLLEKDSLLIVVIAPEGREPLIYHLNGKKGHWQSRLTVPAQVGETSLVAQYAIHALDENIGQVGPSHLHVHGIAAGPKAVGSIGIDQVTFSPATIHTALREKAHYGFHSISDFPRVDVDFIRLGTTQDHQIIAARVDGKTMGSISRNEERSGDWDGKSKVDKDKFSPQLRQWLSAPAGQHLIQVRAWYGQNNGDWAIALSEDLVTVE
ncbi:MAG TPA: hypothetical protein VKE93_18895 [Candidatus Angelobacter sp.]|nr:hypothetical protein [Candidatus Angelobacter sp.]